MPTEKIVVSVVGLLGGVLGIAGEDMAKIKAGVSKSYEPKQEDNQSA